MAFILQYGLGFYCFVSGISPVLDSNANKRMMHGKGMSDGSRDTLLSS